MKEQSTLEAKKLYLTINHKVSPFVLSFSFLGEIEKKENEP